ncbi:NAD-dependent epimerase/dehydratase family protein [Devosia sp. FKR38]|uniref:NAD-dependent epimerase/dehydratase family protein n=1 Tax=Devosia sp. FKR38 TaxID=2562312 RepID=UPI0010BFF10F|nr:NAD-dependent epimerase/dehydratase family protein [Devosia sp. FKR38]
MYTSIHVIGYGALGQDVVRQLVAQGRTVTVLQRSRPRALPVGAVFAAADTLDAASLTQALAKARVVVCALGFPYSASVWRDAWPTAMANVLEACAASGARLVFADNLYLYGPHDGPLTEDLPAVDYGIKPAARAQVTRLWQSAHATGRVQVAAVRSPDFYGPGVTQSVLGEGSLMALARGRSAVLLGEADLPHDVAHVRDYGRAVISLVDASDDAYGQAWHVPCDDTLTLRQHLEIAAKALNVPLRLTLLPRWTAPILGLAVPIVKEGIEMHFLFDRPYRVDATKFRNRFWSDVTPLHVGIAEAALSFRQ